MAETTVVYHSDFDGPGRPAINVKDRHSGMDFVHAVESLIGGPASGLLGESVNGRYPDALRDVAYEITRERFWREAEAIAEPVLGTIHAEGRSGGWLVLDDDPTNGGDERPSREWLAEYRDLVAWSEAFIAEAPAKVAALAQQLAMDEIGRGAARRMFAFVR